MKVGYDDDSVTEQVHVVKLRHNIEQNQRPNEGDTTEQGDVEQQDQRDHAMEQKQMMMQDNSKKGKHH